MSGSHDQLFLSVAPPIGRPARVCHGLNTETFIAEVLLGDQPVLIKAVYHDRIHAS
jgi:hypothetical protein